MNTPRVYDSFAPCTCMATRNAISTGERCAKHDPPAIAPVPTKMAPRYVAGVATGPPSDHVHPPLTAGRANVVDPADGRHGDAFTIEKLRERVAELEAGIASIRFGDCERDQDGHCKGASAKVWCEGQTWKRRAEAAEGADDAPRRMARADVMALLAQGTPMPSQVVELVAENIRLREDLRVARDRAEHAEREAKIGVQTSPFEPEIVARADAAERLCVRLADFIVDQDVADRFDDLVDHWREDVDAMRARLR